MGGFLNRYVNRFIRDCSTKIEDRLLLARTTDNRLTASNNAVPPVPDTGCADVGCAEQRPTVDRNDFDTDGRDRSHFTSKPIFKSAKPGELLARRDALQR
jgi:hypothetical protein